MALRLHWYLPTNGDNRDIVGSGDGSQETIGGVADGFRAPSIEYLSQVAKAAEYLGFEAVLTPTGTWCADAWITTSALSQLTDRLKFLVAFRPGLISPVLAAHQAATFQRLSKGRLLLNIVTGGDSVEQRRLGDWLDHDQRYARTAEFLEVFRGVSDAAEPYSFDGEHYRVADAAIGFAPYEPPPLFFGGASPAAEQVAAKHIDTHISWGEPPAAIAARIERLREQAAAHDREISFGVRFQVISRDSSQHAWDEANRLLAHIDRDAIATTQNSQAAKESVGQQLMNSLHGGTTDNLEIYPNIWAGFGLVRGGAGTAIVGSHKEVAERIAEYHDLGVDHFVLSGQPHLEEAFWFGEGAVPELRRQGLLDQR